MLLIAFGITAMAQQSIQLRSVSKAECVRCDMTSLKASFSFSTIEAQDYESERGTFSWLSLPNTVLGGNEGDPQIPVVNELIAVPFGANPRIEITSYSTTDYRLEDYGIHTLVPRQPSLRKDQRPEDVPFMYNASAYQTRGMRSEPQAVVNVVGTMRGVQLGKMTIEPVSYDPVNNTLCGCSMGRGRCYSQCRVKSPRGWYYHRDFCGMPQGNRSRRASCSIQERVHHHRRCRSRRCRRQGSERGS